MKTILAIIAVSILPILAGAQGSLAWQVVEEPSITDAASLGFVPLIQHRVGHILVNCDYEIGARTYLDILKQLPNGQWFAQVIAVAMQRDDAERRLKEALLQLKDESPETFDRIFTLRGITVVSP